MPTEIVMDSSMIAALVTPEEHSDWASKRTKEHDDFHILDLNYYEVANAIKYKVSGKFTPEEGVKTFAEAVKLMNLHTVHSYSEVITEKLILSLELNITMYDAAFLSLTEKLDTWFLTLDLKLAKKLEGTNYFGILECPNKHGDK